MTSRLAVASITPLLLVLALTGCARKAAQAPPQAAATPAASPASIPSPEPAATEPAPAEPVTSASPSESAAEFLPAFFEYDSYHLSDRAKAALDADARALRTQPALKVTIEGHCDERGTVEYNMSLGERRAQVARDYLVASGVAPARLHIVSYGKERPFTDGESESAWSQNRRAHLVVR